MSGTRVCDRRRIGPLGEISCRPDPFDGEAVRFSEWPASGMSPVDATALHGGGQHAIFSGALSAQGNAPIYCPKTPSDFATFMISALSMRMHGQLCLCQSGILCRGLLPAFLHVVNRQCVVPGAITVFFFIFVVGIPNIAVTRYDHPKLLLGLIIGGLYFS